MRDKLFDSTTDLIPLIRADIEVFPVKADGKELIYFHDSMGYAENNFVLNKELAGLLALLDGNKTVKAIQEELAGFQSHVELEEILRFIRHLDANRILFSPFFKEYASEVEETFESQSLRVPSCSGSSYPDDPEELRMLLDSAFEKIKDEPASGKSRALFAPHIDPRVGLESYVKAFHPLKHMKPSRVVILATSHYAGSYYPFYDNTPYIASRKSFRTPLGESHADQELLDAIEKNADRLGCAMRDRAHRVEHSIEMHLLFLHYLWDHPFKIVPVLIDSFDPLFYKENGYLSDRVEQMSSFLRSRFEDQDDVLFLISGDLSHVGHKFGDTEPASSLLNRVKLFDGEFLEHAVKNDHKRMLQLIRKDYDPFRICGFAPLYTYLKSFDNLEGKVTSYQVWDERERQSAVSFGSVLFGKK